MLDLLPGDEVWVLNSLRNRAHRGIVVREDISEGVVIVRNEKHKDEDHIFSLETGYAVGQVQHNDGTDAWTEEKRPRIVPLDDPEALALRKRQEFSSHPQLIDKALKQFRQSQSPLDYARLVAVIAEWGTLVFRDNPDEEGSS